VRTHLERGLCGGGSGGAAGCCKSAFGVLRAGESVREICAHHGARAANRVFSPMGDDYVCARAPPERAKKRPGLRRAPGENCLMLRRSDAMGAKQ
jgi:hypothetical protein